MQFVFVFTIVFLLVGDYCKSDTVLQDPLYTVKIYCDKDSDCSHVCGGTRTRTVFEGFVCAPDNESCLCYPVRNK